MRKRALAIWPRKKEPEPPAETPEAWVQEEEVLKRQLQRTIEPPRERLNSLFLAMELRKLGI